MMDFYIELVVDTDGTVIAEGKGVIPFVETTLCVNETNRHQRQRMMKFVWRFRFELGEIFSEQLIAPKVAGVDMFYEINVSSQTTATVGLDRENDRLVLVKKAG